MFVMLTAMYHQGFSMTAVAKGDYFVSWSLLDDGYAMWYDIMRMSGARETALRALRGTDEFLDTTGSILQRNGAPTIQQRACTPD